MVSGVAAKMSRALAPATLQKRMIKHQKRVLEIGADVSKSEARPTSRVRAACPRAADCGPWRLIGGCRLERAASCSSAASRSDRNRARRAGHRVACACFNIVVDQKKKSNRISSRYA